MARPVTPGKCVKWAAAPHESKKSRDPFRLMLLSYTATAIEPRAAHAGGVQTESFNNQPANAAADHVHTESDRQAARRLDRDVDRGQGRTLN